MKKTALRIVLGIVVVIAVLVAVLLVRAATLESKQVDVEASKFQPMPGAAERLAEAVRFKTVSNADPAHMALGEFGGLKAFLTNSFPNVHRTMEREVVEPCSLVYRWKGKNADARPVLLASHLDVVPVEPHELEQWTHDPFSGDIEGGYIWGRGTLDDKIGVLGLLEGAEVLIASGHQPERTLVFAFGCDEEVGGALGAQTIAKLFAERGEAFEFAFDEGLAIAKGYVPGIENPVALVGIVEKGFATYVLTVEVAGGHSSMPPKNTAIGILSRAVTRLEDHRMPTSLNPASRQFFETLAPEMDFGMRVVMGNLWLLEPVLISQLAASPQTNASVRTTTAVTIINAGVQDNVLPKKAVAKVNFRILPGETLDDVKRHIVATVDDERVKVELQQGGFGNPPSKISEVDTFGFRTIRDSVRAAFGNDVVVAPTSTTGGTDVRYYESVSDNQYRFAPVMLQKILDDTSRIHGIDERIAIDIYERSVVFYTEFLSRL